MGRPTVSIAPLSWPASRAASRFPSLEGSSAKVDPPEAPRRVGRKTAWYAQRLQGPIPIGERPVGNTARLAEGPGSPQRLSARPQPERGGPGASRTRGTVGEADVSEAC